jgi:tRNA pseudouridine38-40 synthase
LTIAYAGRPFSGFARQEHARTVAGELDRAIARIDPLASRVRGASRTDSGVHASAQRAAFDASRQLDLRGWALALTAKLPPEISVVRAASVPVGYEPRKHTLSKTYRYDILQSAVRDPFLEGRAWRVDERLNQQWVNQELSALIGEHDFAAFRAASDARTNTIRRIFRAEVRTAPHHPRVAEIRVAGNGFLYRMVRIIVGTAVDVGRGRLAPGAVSRALVSGFRRDLGMTAPAQGLILEQVDLDDEEGHDAWPPDLGVD